MPALADVSTTTPICPSWHSWLGVMGIVQNILRVSYWQMQVYSGFLGFQIRAFFQLYLENAGEMTKGGGAKMRKLIRKRSLELEKYRKGKQHGSYNKNNNPMLLFVFKWSLHLGSLMTIN